VSPHGKEMDSPNDVFKNGNVTRRDLILPILGFLRSSLDQRCDFSGPRAISLTVIPQETHSNAMDLLRPTFGRFFQHP